MSALKWATWATLAGQGYSHRRLGQRFGVSQSTISRVMQRYRRRDHVMRPEQGPTPRSLRLFAVRERFTNTRPLQMQLAEELTFELASKPFANVF
jgi:transposase